MKIQGKSDGEVTMFGIPPNISILSKKAMAGPSEAKKRLMQEARDYVAMCDYMGYITYVQAFCAIRGNFLYMSLACMTKPLVALGTISNLCFFDADLLNQPSINIPRKRKKLL